MHEASLVAGLLRIVVEEAEKYNVKRVTKITLELGLLACVEDQTLKACFELLAENTVAEQAVLDIRIQDLACTCDNCAKQFFLCKKAFMCPYCTSEKISFSGGHGLSIQSIEVEGD